ncbi:MAG: hypothetical protein ACC651_14385 [Candidatus Scalindua sp.]
MVKRMTSKERIQQMAEEAEAGEEVKAEKKKKKATTRKVAKSIIKREKVVWKIFDAGYKEVACFPYAQKDEAFAKLEERKLKKSTVNFFINEVKVPMEDDV